MIQEIYNFIGFVIFSGLPVVVIMEVIDRWKESHQEMQEN